MGRRVYTVEERLDSLETLVLLLLHRNHMEHHHPCGSSSAGKCDCIIGEFNRRLQPQKDTGHKCCECGDIGTHQTKLHYRDGTDKICEEVYCYTCGEKRVEDSVYSGREVASGSLVEMGDKDGEN
jgi:hypothetical protein